MRRRPGDESGAAVVFVLGLVSALVLIAVAAVGVTAVVVAHRRAQAAADLAALAAAGELRVTGDACGAAARIARANGAVVRSCAVDGTTVTVTVRLELPELLGAHGLEARARAGPAQPSSGPADRRTPRSG